MYVTLMLLLARHRDCDLTTLRDVRSMLPCLATLFACASTARSSTNSIMCPGAPVWRMADRLAAPPPLPGTVLLRKSHSTDGTVLIMRTLFSHDAGGVCSECTSASGTCEHVVVDLRASLSPAAQPWAARRRRGGCLLAHLFLVLYSEDVKRIGAGALLMVGVAGHTLQWGHNVQ